MKHKAEFILSIINTVLSGIGFLVLLLFIFILNNPEFIKALEIDSAEFAQVGFLYFSILILILSIISLIGIFVYKKGKSVTAISIVSIVFGGLFLLISFGYSFLPSAMLITTGILGLVRRNKASVTFEQ
ncbi:hypothetical protein A374_07046 [Fictibacillus macauensis ZFHKF-1]|uniref:DUF4064 domain-containing protein n=1 Tax=Fictibacillus macauensis ZFHKF-1 TaxID=1196324 RepID=I8AJT9_9BACL|nr:hypothetical protein [Fictibacillus macauensis]EIT86057.1 hypothetical protein A374_07046 [Fictibacillus macauensis ZFHKF-1]